MFASLGFIAFIYLSTYLRPCHPSQAAGANLLLTPHAAFYSEEAFAEMRSLAALEIARILRGELPHYQVN